MKHFIFKFVVNLVLSVFIVAVVFTSISIKASTRSESIAFLEKARHPRKIKTWARLFGLMMHKARRRRSKQKTIKFSLRFTEEMILAQVVVGDSEEIYSIGQPYSGKTSEVSIIREKGEGKESILKRNFGVRPEDLTMSFLFWKYKLELPKTSLKGQCSRVFLLAQPDSDRIAKVYISEKYLFPLKVEWASLINGRLTNTKRTLEVDSFKKVNGLWLVDTLLFYGSGWRTKVSFSKCDAGFVSDGTPKDLFKIPERINKTE
jgi:hypothetical protein